MCVLFFITNPNPSENGYKLILINNRDEFYYRPTKIANFWDGYPNIISGLDLEPGKEGGTWLGMTRNGKIGVLLNILHPKGTSESLKKGRGFLVTDFLKTTSTGDEYLENIHKEGHLYNTFNLITLEMNSNIKIEHYTNTCDEPPISLQSGEYGFGNSSPKTPWKKVVVGQKKFSHVISKHKTTATVEKLIEELIGILDDDTTMLPDPQLESQAAGRGEEFPEKLSALKVSIPDIQYGTRTNTVILVDSHNQVTFVERTMKDETDPNNPEWIVTKHVFQMM